ncbi:MAG: hypothetical protein RLY58_2349 [Pseudomonadota bacterium]|jgi:hypothetical protein
MADSQTQPDNAAKSTPERQFVSRWGNLSRLKIAHISLCNKDGTPFTDSPVVEALLTEGEFSVESDYQSPFESSNPEQRLPTLLGMLQSGEIASTLAQSKKGDGWLGQGLAIADDIIKAVESTVGLPGTLGEVIKSVEGKSSLTKINSTQIFVSTHSIRMQLTLFLQAIYDAKTEVEDQVQLLEKWCVPKKLADSLLESAAEKGLFEGLFPSEAPPFIRIEYGGRVYAPFLITSVNSPLVAPTDSKGNRLSLSVSMSIVSRQAWDATDIDTLYGVKK